MKSLFVILLSIIAINSTVYASLPPAKQNDDPYISSDPHNVQPKLVAEAKALIDAYNECKKSKKEDAGDGSILYSRLCSRLYRGLKVGWPEEVRVIGESNIVSFDGRPFNWIDEVRGYLFMMRDEMPFGRYILTHWLPEYEEIYYLKQLPLLTRHIGESRSLSMKGLETLVANDPEIFDCEHDATAVRRLIALAKPQKNKRVLSIALWRVLRGMIAQQEQGSKESDRLSEGAGLARSLIAANADPNLTWQSAMPARHNDTARGKLITRVIKSKISSGDTLERLTHPGGFELPK